MKRRTWKYLGWILLSEAVGGLAAFLTRDGVEYFNLLVEKPPLSPPGALFPWVWAVLYLLMGIGAARVYLSPPSAERSRGLLFFGLQLAFNFVWSIFFFNLEAYGLSFVWLAALWALILLMTLSFRKVDAWAGRLQIPYLLWVLFAGYLNLGVWWLNGLS